ncbi:MAG: peptidoglycan DD-metalloendopeptidase family protein, partial [Bacteroidetes bacterium]|nr:peptidoglycan DD-metalloendopeptidase family protein [Bacteroidota bacterium]
AVLTTAGLFTLGIVNNSYGDFLGLGLKTAGELSTENILLRNQLAELNERMDRYSEYLNSFAQSDNQLRSIVNLPKIDYETRQLGTGGASAESYEGLVSSEAGKLISASQTLLNKLDKEIEFQKGSYEAIYRQYENNKVVFSSIPAIKPMVGTYSYHGFGMRKDPFIGVLKRHEGVDIHNDVGTPVYATGDGVVEFSGPTGSGYGIALELNHGFGYKSWYAHLSKCVARSGERVKRGQLIAYSGNTGRSTGPHLHYEVIRNGDKMNPVEFFVDDVDYEKIRSQLVDNRK